jgi:hypothetical protein
MNIALDDFSMLATDLYHRPFLTEVTSPPPEGGYKPMIFFVGSLHVVILAIARVWMIHLCCC